ncbi:MAG: DUF3293 domain-containing protein [Cupriavidus sp.]|nr:MAG: DUF3293 domain-containing protein [Cupriavidus sp.]
MFSDSAIPQDLVQAYLETHYQVQGSAPMVLRVGEVNLALAALHAAAGVDCSAFITAWNPLSVQQEPARNLALQQSLEHVLQQRGWRWINGVGQHPVNSRPGEESFLMLGVALDDARALGVQFGQNAIVWSGADALPQLILLR